VVSVVVTAGTVDACALNVYALIRLTLNAAAKHVDAQDACALDAAGG
jgi:hypothetical protein